MAGLKLSSKPKEPDPPAPPQPEQKKVEPPPPEGPPPIPDVGKWLDEMETLLASNNEKLRALDPEKKIAGSGIPDPEKDEIVPDNKPEVTFESIKPGMTPEEVSAVTRAILGAMPKASVTVGPVSTDANLTEAQVAQQKIEAASAPPTLPDLNGKTDAEKNAIVTKYVADRDNYFQNLMARPAGTQFTKSESSALAGEVLAALRADGHRV